MQIAYLSSDQRDTWDALAAQSPSFTLMQSWEWGRLKQERGWQALHVAVEGGGRLIAGAQILVSSLPLGLGSIAYVPGGPIGDWQSNEVSVLLLDELKRIADEKRVLFLRIEPAMLCDPEISRRLNHSGFVSSNFTNQPRASLIVDLTPSLNEILAQMKKKTQTHIRHAESNGVTVRLGDEKDLPAFYELMRETGNRCGFLARTYDYYEQQWRTFASRDEAIMLLAYYGDQLLGARMGFRFGNHAAGLHVCSNLKQPKLRANWLLVWEEIKWAKSLGCCTLDLWGIPDEVGEAIYRGKDIPTTGPEGGLWGVYQFKRGFTKNVVYYVGAYDYVRAPLLYRPVVRVLNNQALDRLTAGIDSIRSICGATKPGLPV